VLNRLASFFSARPAAGAGELREAEALGWISNMDDLWYNPEWPEWEPRYAPPSRSDMARMAARRSCAPTGAFVPA
jgi:hypothetical protein